MKSWGMNPTPISQVVLVRKERPIQHETNSVAVLLSEARKRIREAIQDMDFEREVHVIYILDTHEFILLDSSIEHDAIVIAHLYSYGSTPKPMMDGSIVESHVMWAVDSERARPEDISNTYDGFVYLPVFKDFNNYFDPEPAHHE